MAGNRAQVNAELSFSSVSFWICPLSPASWAMARFSSAICQASRFTPSRIYSLGAAAADRSWRRSGRTEKNLCRQGSQRNAGIPRRRLTMDVAPVMRSAEMRCNSRLPQILQCAYKKVRNGIKRA